MTKKVTVILSYVLVALLSCALTLTFVLPGEAQQPGKLQELQARQAELEALLDEKMERWVYLTELKEKIDAQ